MVSLAAIGLQNGKYTSRGFRYLV